MILTPKALRWPYALALVCALAAGPLLWAQHSRPTESQVKAAYLYGFGRFVQWPAPANSPKDSPFNICVLGEDPFGATLDATLAGQSLAGRKVAARRISSPKDSSACQILFLGPSEEGQLSEIIGSLDKAAILTVSDMPHFTERGGMIQFVLEGDRVRFEVNLTAAQNAGLSLSAELLQVALAVRKDAAARN
ncbi:MAG TPA: YfiR family protein [Terriglobales bacterium]|nr:YfiR family protein [Terriglobales bacterium]